MVKLCLAVWESSAEINASENEVEHKELLVCCAPIYPPMLLSTHQCSYLPTDAPIYPPMLLSTHQNWPFPSFKEKIILRVASNQEKSRSVKSLGILQNGQGNFKYQESDGKVREFHDFGFGCGSLFAHFKGKGTQKYKWILSKIIWKTAHFYANCIKIRFLFFKILRFYIFKMAANGGRHFEINIKTENG